MSEPFVGREEELRTLGRSVAEALAGAGRLVLVSGEPGIGKTRLAEEISRRASADGYVVAWGRSWEGEGTPAYWPWLQALRALAAIPSLRPHFEEARETSLELVTLLGGTRPPSEPNAGDPEQARFRLFDAIGQLFRGAGADKPLLIVLDDLHAADVSTLLLLRFVARDLRESRLLLVATARDASFQPTPAAAQLLTKVAREALHVPLGRLAREDLARWVDAVAPRLASRVDSVLATSEGNPLFVGELIAAAQKRGDAAWTSAHELPHGIREAIREHLALLSAPSRQLLENASVLGRDFQAATLGGLMGKPEDDVRGLLEEAMSLSVVSDAGDGRMLFAHVLLRDELYAGLAPAHRAELHRAAASRLERLGKHAGAAHHWLLGARAEDAANAVATVLAAMRDATVQAAFEDAAQLGERALATLATHLAMGEHCTLLAKTGEAWILAGESARGRETCLRAAELATSLGDGELLARAALLFTSEVTLGRHDEETQLLRRALAALPAGDSPLRAQVMARLAGAMMPPTAEEGDEPYRLVTEALAMARRVGDDATLMAALRFATTILSETFGIRERIALNDETIALAQKLGQIPRVLTLLGSQVACHLELGDPDGAERALERAERLLLAFPQPHYRWRAPLLRAMVASLQGRFAEADALGRDALHLCQEHDLKNGLIHAFVNRIMLQYNRGDDEGWSELEKVHRKTIEIAPHAALFFSFADAMSGRVDQARARLDQVVVRKMRTLGVGNLGWACVQAGLTEHAAPFYEIVRSSTDRLQFGPSSVGSSGPTALLLGRLAAMLGRGVDAEAHYEEALAIAHQLRARPYVAQTELAWAEELGKRGAPEARARAEAARRAAHELGMRAVEARAQALIESLAIGAATAATAKAPVSTAIRPRTVTLARHGGMWTLTSETTQVMLRDAKGLAYLEALVRDPHREIHALDLAGVDVEGDAGPMLDTKSKQAYRARVAVLREELDEATQHGDLGRAERARGELETIAEELARAVGLGGRDRVAASAAERARINVQRRLRDIVRRIKEQDGVMGRHLEVSVKTGIFCVYVPAWPA